MDTRLDINDVFAHLFEPEPANRFYVERGGAGSGKSYAAAQAVITNCLGRTQDGAVRRWLIVRKVRATMRHSVFELLLHVLRQMGLYRPGLVWVNRSEMTITFFNGCSVICTGLDDAEKLKSIHDVTHVWIEEATELSLADYRQVNLRMRGPGIHHWMILTFNPVSVLSWVKSEFFDEPPANTHTNHTTYRDNKFIDDEYRRELESLADKDPYFHTVYTLGEWGVLGNLVFHNFVIERFPYTEGDLDSVSQGMDFGYNHASVIERCGWRDGELYVFDELYLKGYTNAEFINSAFGGVLPKTFAGTIVADSAEPDRIREWNAALPGGAVVGAKKGKDSVRMGIDYLKRQRLHIHAERCPNLAREIQGYKWREDKHGEPMEEPVPFNDDTIAALRYAVEDLWATPGQFAVLRGTREEHA